ncbi:hypothetical protein RDI58_004141 [Solanum bulbocastanum]|uniref:Ninja-family protein n=1 Tax=Solanum bulbocastanum TaxID=147425 RepID=A0AAN8TYC2_SOLBU
MATPKGKTSTYRSDEQEIDLNLTIGGLYNTENPNEISVPQPFSQIIESVANNLAFQRAIEIIRFEMNNNAKDMPEINEKRKTTSPTCVPESNRESAIKFNEEKGKSIHLPESNGEKPSKKVKNSDEVLDKGKSIELPESNGEKPLKKVKNSDEVLDKISNGEKVLKKIKNSHDEVLDKESNGEKVLKKIKNSDEVLDKGKSIVLQESYGEKALKKVKNSNEVLDKGKSIVLQERYGEKALKKVKNSDEVLDKESNGEKPLKKVKNSDNIVNLMNVGELKDYALCDNFWCIINRKLTEAILYNGGQEKQISILCICHERFFTAAEFVKHGGGKEVDNPMKFIKVVDDA